MTSRRERLGLPDYRSQRPFLAAMLIDASGSGVFVPFSILYFVVTTDLSLTAIGGGLTIANGLSLLAGPLAGTLTDRYGARPVSLVSNLLRATGLLGYLLVGTLPSLVLAALVVSLGDRAFWASYGALIGEVARPGERQRWFGLLTAVRNLGLGLGGLLGGLLVTGGTRGAHAVVVLDALSFLLCAALLTRVRTRREPGRRAAQPGAWSTVLRDRPYLVLSAGNALLTTGWLVLTVVLPVYLVETLALPRWLPGACFALNCLVIVGLQTLVVRRTEHLRRTRSIACAAGLLVLCMLLFLAADGMPRLLASVLVVVAVLIYTLGEIVYSPAADALAAEAAPEDLRGRYQSVWQTSWTISNTIGPALAGALLDTGPVALWAVFATFAALGGAVVLAVEPHLPPDGVRGARQALDVP